MTSTKVDLTDRAIFPRWVRNVMRYNDTDRQGHVNHAVFITLCESGRAAILSDPKAPIAPEGFAFVVARILLEYRGEIYWPCEVETGTGVLSLGNSSFVIGHGLFIGSRCVATAEVVSVTTDVATRKSTPLPAVTRAALDALSIRAPSSPSPA